MICCSWCIPHISTLLFPNPFLVKLVKSSSSSTPQSRYWSSPSCFWHRVSSICKGKSGGAVSTTLLLRSVPRRGDARRCRLREAWKGLDLSNCDWRFRGKNTWLVVLNIFFIFIYFPFHVWDNPNPIDFHIFQEGYCTTNQQTTGSEPHILCMLSYFLNYVLLALLGCSPVSIRMGLSMFLPSEWGKSCLKLWSVCVCVSVFGLVGHDVGLSQTRR